MFKYSFVIKEHKVAWLKQWNEFGVMREAKKFPKQGFSDVQFDKQLHKAPFWHQVIFQIFLFDFPFSIFSPHLV